MSTRISASPRAANEAENIHPRRPRLQKRGGCTGDVRHNRWKNRGYRVGMIKNAPKNIFFFFREALNNCYWFMNKYNYIYRDQGQVLKVLSGGDFFGEIGILSLSEGQNRWGWIKIQNKIFKEWSSQLLKHWSLFTHLVTLFFDFLSIMRIANLCFHWEFPASRINSHFFLISP